MTLAVVAFKKYRYQGKKFPASACLRVIYSNTNTKMITKEFCVNKCPYVWQVIKTKNFDLLFSKVEELFPSSNTSSKESKVYIYKLPEKSSLLPSKVIKKLYRLSFYGEKP